MNLLPFGKLPAYKPRKFVPPTIDLGDWPQIAPLFDQLEKRAPRLPDRRRPRTLAARLERTQRRARRGILPPLHRDDLPHRQRRTRKRPICILSSTSSRNSNRASSRSKKSTIRRRLESRVSADQRQIADAELVPPYEVFDRDVKSHVELFRPENVPLETEEAKLCQQYQKLSGSLTVNFRGEEKTLVQMGRYLEEPDRALRQEAWELVTRRRLQEADKFDDILDAQIKLRQQIAHNAGFKNYRDYAFRRLGRFDYTPEDCEKFHDAVERHVMPVMRELQAERRSAVETGQTASLGSGR